ncbi:AAA family ATPase [Gordonia westfalica]|uniref:AAA family ATPase n=1 Tax=Gordonia westfalica TaxID=158898 RepID=A0ABU2GYU2_9ACTN|nr:AAA family ATPase [Gordonia westfalica]MDS1116638.1 AAA family ATPase [Gordonia westfalica]
MELNKAIAAGHANRDETLQARQAQQHAAFLERFPLASWGDVSLADYALNAGNTRNNYSYFLEWGTPELGSIAGGSAHKHVIFRRTTGEWAYPSGYANVEEAWAALHSGFNQMFELAQQGDWTSTSEIDILRGAKVVRLKSLYLYFSEHVLPIYSQNHLIHFARAFGLDTSGDAIDINLRLLRHLRGYPELESLDSLDFIGLLYSWSPPPGSRSPKYWKIAPGERGRLWNECVAGGYMCVGWDEVGDLSLFTTEDDYTAAFTDTFAEKYRGNRSTITRKSKELWRLMEIAEGDKIVANRGTSEVLGVGTVTSTAYQWRPERSEYKHTINVNWDLDVHHELSEPVKRWATTTIAKIPSTHLEQILTPEPNPDPAPTIRVDPEAEAAFTRWKSILDRKGQLIFYGPPGTGKTRAAKKFAEWLLQDQDGAVSADQLTEVTFHASYAYEDFIEGFRPMAGESELRLELRDGIFKQVAKRASADTSRRYVIIIDEINRADVPRVFGELMTVIERTRRGESVTLPTSGEQLSIPPNVIVLGTMNTADQSIRSLDAALRRRFGFIELLPDPDLLADTTIDDLPLDQFLQQLNDRVARIAGRERQIGHSYFLDHGEPIESAEAFGEVLRTDIIPLLQEIVYDDYAQLRDFLGSGIVDAGAARLTHIVNDDSQLVAALADNYGLKIRSTPE